MATWTRKNNCYSYAAKYPHDWLQVDAWYSRENIIEELLERNPNWRPVTKSDLVLGKEYVAFRYGQDDFHFMRRTKTGHWRHKCGSGMVKSVSQKEVFDREWIYAATYNSKLYLFEVEG